jgi:hypothetical protein
MNELQANGIYKFYFAFQRTLPVLQNDQLTQILQRIALCETSKM